MALYLGKINSQWKVGVLDIVCSCPVEKCGGETGGTRYTSQREILRSAPLVTMASLALILLLISAMEGTFALDVISYNKALPSCEPGFIPAVSIRNKLKCHVTR